MRSFSSFAILIILLVTGSAVLAGPATNELSQFLPVTVGEFHRAGTVEPVQEGTDRADLNDSVNGQVGYVSRYGKFQVELVRFKQDSQAFSFFSFAAYDARQRPGYVFPNVPAIGTAAIETADQIIFCKGPFFIRITSTQAHTLADKLNEFAKLIADPLDKGEGDVPVLLKHLPPSEIQKEVLYFYQLSQLTNVAPDQQDVLSAIDSQADGEGVVAKYGQARLLIVEFHTPQLAAENDQRVVARIHELWNQGKPAPSAYRRVGNYSVFVFSAPDESTAKQLVDQIKYEQVVRWLGENPYILQEAKRRYTETTLGVLVSVLKASGFALVGCFAVGGFFGALLFGHRRAHQRGAEAYSDAGGMLRLNIDELTAKTTPARFLNGRN
ncbi:MAG: DUF6599 family protein [Pyrinomonadaceae bacterium]